MPAYEERFRIRNISNSYGTYISIFVILLLSMDLVDHYYEGHFIVKDNKKNGYVMIFSEIVNEIGKLYQSNCLTILFHNNYYYIYIFIFRFINLK